MLIIENSGQRIVKTNYWTSEHAKAGFLYLSWNAGAGRILLPDNRKQMLAEMRGAKYVIVSRGPWADQGQRDALELLFEDESDNPFCVHMLAEQCDRMLPEASQGGGFSVTVWTQTGEKLRFPGKYRTVEAVPCLQPWNEH